MYETSLGEVELDALKELGNIGAGRAATALSKLVGRTIEMSVPKSKIVKISELNRHISDEIVAGVLTGLQDIEGQNSGYLYIMFPKDSSISLVKTLCGSESLGEMEESALMEVGNILSSSFCDATAEMLGLVLLPSPPGLAIDYALAVVDSVVSIMAESSDTIIFFENQMRDQEDLKVYLMLIPEARFFKNMLGLLKMVYA